MEDIFAISAIPAARLTAHQPPALLIERVVTLLPAGGTVRLAAHQGLDAWQLLEACAQAVAVLTGARQRRQGNGAPASGLLVGAKPFVVDRTAIPGEVVEVTTRLTHSLGVLQLHAVEASTASGERLAHGDLKVASTGAA